MNRVEFNLLPDLKMNVVKANRTRNTIISIAFLAAAASLAVFLLLALTVYGVQKAQLSQANKNIKAANNRLKSIEGLERVLTVQNQLHTLTSLHANKHAAARIFAYLPQVTPTNVSIGNLTVDFSTNTMKISGTASSQHAVNTFIDSLKFTTYRIGADSEQRQAFPTVIETSIALADGKATYELDVQFDPELFSNVHEAPTLQVPTQVTTRSVLQDPNNLLFNGQTGETKDSEQ